MRIISAPGTGSALPAGSNNQVLSLIGGAATFVNGLTELGRATAAGAVATLTVQNLPSCVYLFIVGFTKGFSGNDQMVLRFNNDGANNYHTRYTDNDGATTASGAASSIWVMYNANTTVPQRIYGHVLNVQAIEKWFSGKGVQGTAGAANALNRRDFDGKWANTVNVINRVDIFAFGGANFQAGDALIVYGSL